ncbi:hypothetical protein CI41S_30230 [Bradyrhizobium ivorense]|nr:hypothetical protein CI41S_30230 [Bradyrhizobium ivorense]
MTSGATSIDVARVELLLNELRLPGVKAIWPKLAARSDKEGWPAARFLAALAEHEAADRTRRRIERHMAEARLPAGKTLATFDFESVPMLSKAQAMALAAGDVWLKTGANLLLFGPPESDSYCPPRYAVIVQALFGGDRQTTGAGRAAPVRRS